VWLSNQYSNSGVEVGRVSVRPSDFANGEFPEGFFAGDWRNQPRPDETDPNNPLAPITTTEVNIVDPDFKLPKVLRTNVALDHQLAYGLVGTVEGLYTRSINDVFYQNINLGPQVGENPLDGRPVYERRSSANFNEVILLTNSSRGYQTNLTFQIDRPAADGIFGRLAYTWGQARDVNSGTSSQARSNWNNNYTAGDPNASVLATSLYEVRHRVIGALSYRRDFLSGAPTTLTVFYEGRSGQPFSYLYTNDVNGDGQINDLVYIPASADEVTMDNWDAFNAFIEDDSYLRSQRGQIVDRNGARGPWVNQIDLRVAQQVPSRDGQRFEVTLDVLNVANLVNGDWGRVETVNWDYGLVRYDGIDAESGLPALAFQEGNPYNVHDLRSRWQAQLGLRYTF
jgi:hypothetical protein